MLCQSARLRWLRWLPGCESGRGDTGAVMQPVEKPICLHLSAASARGPMDDAEQVQPDRWHTYRVNTREKPRRAKFGFH